MSFPIQSGAPTQTSVATSSSYDPSQGPVQSPSQSPVQSTATFAVPKGQLERTRGSIPQGWSSNGGHNGFKAASIEQVAAGYTISAVNPNDIPRGRR